MRRAAEISVVVGRGELPRVGGAGLPRGWRGVAGAELGGELPRQLGGGEVAKQLTDASVRVHRVELMPAMPNCRRNCYQGKGVSLLKTPALFPPWLEANATFSWHISISASCRRKSLSRCSFYSDRRKRVGAGCWLHGLEW